MSKLLAKLPERFQWTLHNLIAHPLSEILFQLGLHKAGDWIHEITIPEHAFGTGRG
jgi:ethanolamine utilization microcompartment shell protein EutS